MQGTKIPALLFLPKTIIISFTYNKKGKLDMAKFFDFNDGTKVCVDGMQVRYIRPVIDTDLQCRSMYSREEFVDITEKKPAGVSRIVVSRGGERVYEERPVIAYEVTVIFQGTTEDKIYLRVDEYDRFLETVGEEDSKATDKTYADLLGPLPQAVFDSAPEWAKYAAMDDDGSIYLYEEEPIVYEDDYVWGGVKDARQERCWLHVTWKKSLTKRSK